MLSKGQIVGIDLNRIARLHSHVLTRMDSLTASQNLHLRVNAYKNGPKSLINGTSRKINFACISSLDRS